MCPLDRRAHSSPDMLTPWEQAAHGGRTYRGVWREGSTHLLVTRVILGVLGWW